MGNPNDVWLCTFRAVRQSRTEIDISLVFDPKNNRLQIRVSQDYETQAKIEFSYSDADAYFATHQADREKAWEVNNDHMANNPGHVNGMTAALARMKNL